LEKLPLGAACIMFSGHPSVIPSVRPCAPPESFVNLFYKPVWGYFTKFTILLNLGTNMNWLDSAIKTSNVKVITRRK